MGAEQTLEADANLIARFGQDQRRFLFERRERLLLFDLVLQSAHGLTPSVSSYASGGADQNVRRRPATASARSGQSRGGQDMRTLLQDRSRRDGRRSPLHGTEYRSTPGRRQGISHAAAERGGRRAAIGMPRRAGD